MRIQRMLWVMAILSFGSLLYAQRGQSPGQQPAPAQQPAGQQPAGQQETPAVNENQSQAVQGQVKTNQNVKKPQGPVPLTEKEVTKEIKSSPAETLIKDVKERGVDFDMTPEIEKKLRKAKATDDEVEAIRQAGPKVRAQTAKLVMQGAGTTDIPKEQGQAYDAIKTELDPDKAIGLADDFAKKYPDSKILTYVYSFQANAYQQKGDVEKVVETCNKSLQLNPDNLMSLVLSIGMMPQPQYLNAHKNEQETVLQEAQKRATRALELIAKLPKQANESDADYQKRLGEIASQVHGPLGMIHLELANGGLAGPDKAELAKAEQEFNTAVTTTAHPDPRDYYRMGEAYAMDSKWDDAIQAFTKAGDLGQGTLIKTYADQQIGEIKKKKAAQGSGGKS
jgi:tetratricopeptide (TPR) repeat protein